MSLTQDKSDLLFFFPFFSELLSLELCLCRWPSRSVHRAALCHRGWRAGGLSGWWQSLWWNAGQGEDGGRSVWGGGGGGSRREPEWEVRVHGWVAAQPQPGAASPSLLMVSGASQDQWLREGGFCWPHFVQDEIHIYPPPHEDR